LAHAASKPTRGSGQQLASQLLGLLTISALATVPTAVLTLILSRFGYLRTSEECEARGHDFMLFGMRAYVQHSDVLKRLRVMSNLLDESGLTCSQLLDALKSLRLIIYRPLSPQDGD
jgi:hypothetical protein